MAKKKWLKDSVNPKHRGFCTPMTKKTCTPHRKAFAKRAKAHKLKAGGSGIEIKESHKGLFTKKAKEAGMSVQAFATHIHAHPEHYSAATRKQANFARNAKHFHHQNGGEQQFDFMNPDMNVDNSQYDQQPTAGPGSNSFLNTRQGQALANRYKKMGYIAHVDENGKVHFIKGQQGQKQENPIVKGFNEIASGVTAFGDKLQENKLRQQEKIQMLQNMTPKFMTNMEQEGLHNVPAYTKYGGEPTNGAPIGVVDSNTGPGLTDEMYEGLGRTSSVYGKQMLYDGKFKNGGEVSSDKAKEILRDGTVHGHPLTARQKRYFGWIAGGSKQAGGSSTPDPSNANLDAYHGQNAILSYYKNKLNEKLKAKNPQGFTDYFKGLQQARAQGEAQAQKYIQGSNYNDYLSPDETKKTLGPDYNAYLNSLKAVNTYNVQQGREPLYGTIEGKNDVGNLNFGRRFASLQVNPRFGMHVNDKGQGRDYSRQYTFDPNKHVVNVEEEGDKSLRPKFFANTPIVSEDVLNSLVIPNKQMGGKYFTEYGGDGYWAGGEYEHGGIHSYQNGGGNYSVGDEVELSDAEIKKMKKMGYKFEEI